MQGVVRMIEQLALSTRRSEIEPELRKRRKPEGHGAISFPRDGLRRPVSLKAKER